LPEVAGDAALLVPPDDEDALHATLQRLLDEPELRATLRRRAPERAARFTWDGAARALRAAYAEAREREPLAASAPLRPPPDARRARLNAPSASGRAS
jgi:glycosyltransferase involved in cell wall biosynthesis